MRAVARSTTAPMLAYARRAARSAATATRRTLQASRTAAEAAARPARRTIHSSQVERFPAAEASTPSPSVAPASSSAASAARAPAAPLPVLIIGGGLAGLTLGRACHLANIPFIVFERSAELENGSASSSAAGTGLGLWGPAERVLDALGLGGQIRSVSRRMGCAGYRTTQGDWLAQPPITPGRGDLRSCLTVPRGDLQTILLQSIPAQHIKLGHTFASSSVEADGSVTVRFENGSEVRGSLLVAADGINSAVRAQQHPSVKPKYCGYVYFRATRELPAEAFPPAVAAPTATSAAAAVSRTTVMRPSSHASSPAAAASSVSNAARWDWPGSTVAAAWETWGLATRVAYVPLRDRLAFWFLSCEMDEEEAVALGESIARAKQEGRPTPGLPLDPSLWHDPIPTLLATTPSKDIVFTPIRSVNLPPSSWALAAERTVILGDGAHAVPPNLASGGMMSIQDSMQLAASLRPVFEHATASNGGRISEERLADALQQYVDARKWPVRVIQFCSYLVARIGQLSSPSLIQLRDGAIQLIPFGLRNALFRLLHRAYLGGEYTPPRLGSMQGLYGRFMPREEWEAMPQLLHLFHARPMEQQAGGAMEGKAVVHRCEGRAECRVGSSLLARLAARFASMPPALSDAAVSVDITQHPDGSEDWQRFFRGPPLAAAGEKEQEAANRVFGFLTHQYTEGGRMVEAVPLPLVPKFAQVEFLFDVEPLDCGFMHRIASARVRFLPGVAFGSPPREAGVLRGGFSVPLPRALRPTLTAETSLSSLDARCWDFHVSVCAPSNVVTRALMSSQDNMEIAGYSGRIERFNKREVADWFNGANKLSAAAATKATATPAGARAFSTSTRRRNHSVSASGRRRFSSVASSPPSSRFRVLILGGYGLFGKRVASGLLLRDPALNLPPMDVLVNARNDYANEHQQILEHVRSKATATYPAHAAEILTELDARLSPAIFDANRPGVLAAQLQSLRVHAVINCVGPFQTADYSIALTCAAAGVHYIDLADSRTFVTGFHAAVDATARSHGVVAVSGASSVPGLSSAVVQRLRDQFAMDRVTGIDVAIAPGNHTPRGLATMQSILGQVGRTPCTWRRDGAEQQVLAWGSVSRAAAGYFSPRLRSPRRLLSAIDIPDLDLLPRHFAGPDSNQAVANMRFRAGLELPLMHWGLWAMGWIVRAGIVRDLTPWAGWLKRLSELPMIALAGSDTGGMYVQVSGLTRRDGVESPVHVVWRLYAGSGEGLQIPATASVVLTNKLQRQWIDARAATTPSASTSVASSASASPALPTGAYPCLTLFSVDEFMAQLRPYDISADCVVLDTGAAVQ